MNWQPSRGWWATPKTGGRTFKKPWISWTPAGPQRLLSVVFGERPEIVGRVDVHEGAKPRIDLGDFFRRNFPRPQTADERHERKVAFPQRFLDERQAPLSVNGAERLRAAGTAGDHQVGILRFSRQQFQQGGGKKRRIATDDENVRVSAEPECGVHPGDRSLSRDPVGYFRAGDEVEKAGVVGDQKNILEQGLQGFVYPGDQRSAPERKERLVPAHPAGFSAGQDGGRHVPDAVRRFFHRGRSPLFFPLKIAQKRTPARNPAVTFTDRISPAVSSATRKSSLAGRSRAGRDSSSPAKTRSAPRMR